MNYVFVVEEIIYDDDMKNTHDRYFINLFQFESDAKQHLRQQKIDFVFDSYQDSFQSDFQCNTEESFKDYLQELKWEDFEELYNSVNYQTNFINQKHAIDIYRKKIN